MKVTIVILACLAIAGVNGASVHKNTNPVDKAFLEKQKFLLEIVYRVDHPLQFVEWIKLGGKLIVDESKYQQFNQYMTQFYQSFKVGGLLPKGEFFSEINKIPLLQAWGLFNFFYYANDVQTFMQNVAWARINVNEGMFVYALTLAVIHRPDLKGLILPPIYEILPQLFLTSKTIVKAEKFDMDVFNRQIMLEKELKTIYHQDYDTKVIEDRFYMRDWKIWQWWKLMGLDEDWHLEEKTFLRNNIEQFKNDPKYKAVWTDIKAFWTPVDYTRDVEIVNEDTKLSYLTEDVGWNAYWYYTNMDFPRLMNGKEFNIENQRRGEVWIYNVQQYLTRYYMERLSHGLGDVTELTYHGIVQNGYDSQLITYNGNGFTMRKNYYDLESHQNVDVLSRLLSVERRIRDVIDTGKYVTKDGHSIDLTKPESIEYIGSLMQGNYDIIDKTFLGYWYSMSLVYLSGGDIYDFTVVPNVLQTYETMMRDPIIYHLLKRITDIYFKFKNTLPPYKHEQLILPGVKIVDVEVSKLKTFFDLVDIDVSTLLNDKMVFNEDKFVWDKTLLARQTRLNHKPFNIEIKVNSEHQQPVVVRTFIAPSFDNYGQKINLLTNRENFMQLDEFVYDLVKGENVIKRSSNDFYHAINDRTTYTELYKYVMLAYEGKQEFPMEISQPHCGFPNRLLLPRGWVSGLPMKLFFIVTPLVTKQEQHTTNPTTGCLVRYVDDLPLGYPFDRKIENVQDFVVPNMFFLDTKIYHTVKYEKYYPKKYEHFGTFDYTY